MEKINKKQYDAKYKQKRYEAGLCVDCGKPRQDSYALCEACRKDRSESNRQRYLLAKKNRCCTRCAKPLEENSIGKTCLGCWFSGVAVITLGSRTQGKDLKELFEKQGGRCIYTDAMLIPGENASIDHKIPRCRGGENSLENLQWVTSDINRVKGKRTHEEFVAVCQYIAKKFSS